MIGIVYIYHHANPVIQWKTIYSIHWNINLRNMYCGDFNSRTGSKDDLIKNPDCSNNPNLTIKSIINRNEVKTLKYFEFISKRKEKFFFNF